MTGAKLQLVKGEGLVSGISLIWCGGRGLHISTSCKILTSFPLYPPWLPAHTMVGWFCWFWGRGCSLYHGFLAPSIYWNQSFSKLNVPVIIRVGLNMIFIHFVIHCTTTMACVRALAGQAFIYSVLIPLPPSCCTRIFEVIFPRQ